jgi:hypothetical protein
MEEFSARALIIGWGICSVWLVWFVKNPDIHDQEK